jgi:hypothetical protein
MLWPITIEGRLHDFGGPVVFHFLSLSETDVQPLLASGIKRWICSIEGLDSFHCAILNSKVEGYYISLNQERIRKLKLPLGGCCTLSLVPDESTYGMPIPPEMAQILEEDPESYVIFEALSDGKKRSLLYWIGGFKNEKTRLHKTLLLFEYLHTAAPGTFDFKALNSYIKNQS